MGNNLFKVKPLSEILSSNEEGHQLKKTLTASSLVILGIGVIIGAGLFSITGYAAGNNAGPSITISFLIAALGCAFAGLCYAEFASMIPIAGSAYTYSYATMGEFIAWIIGWDLILEYAVGAATVAISWSRYLVAFCESIGVHLPPQLIMSPFDTVTLESGVEVSGIINLPAVFVVLFISIILIKGIKESAIFTSFIVVLKLAVVFAFIILGWNYINPANHEPYIIPNQGVMGEFGWSGIFRAAGILFFAYIGFDAVSTAAQETKNPKKDMPIGILGSLFICTILYVLFAHVMTGLASYKEFQGQDGIAPVAVAIGHTPYAWLKQGVIIAILAGYMSVILVLLMGQTRVFFTMAKDGLVPKRFSAIHPHFQTPHKATYLFAVFVSLFAAFVPGRVVGEMTSIGTLFAFILVCIGIIVMRKKMPDAPREFRTPLVPLVPILGVLVCLFMMVFLPLDTWIRLIVWMVIGFDVYYFYGSKNSNLNTTKTFEYNTILGWCVILSSALLAAVAYIHHQSVPDDTVLVTFSIAFALIHIPYHLFRILSNKLKK
ncbi:MAG: amino acid permease [Chitinophagales bacterium]|nr:amino acid permease [Chitinophagales bacterium]MCZ2394632.1 amino acid permease [Chitinophagales bacterium]